MNERSPKFDPASGLTGSGAVASRFVPEQLDATQWAQLEPLYRALLERPIDSAEDLERWLLDRSELDAKCSEDRATLYITMTCHTSDESISDRWSSYLDEVPPKLKPMGFALDKRQVELFERFSPDPDRYKVLDRNTRVEVELFREENVALETRQSKLDQKYEQICGAMTVEFRGQERTIPQMGRYLQEDDRAVREQAWRAVADRRLQDKAAIEDIFDELVQVRHQIARNAGYTTYLDYIFPKYRRFDYRPEDCLLFHQAVEDHAVPFMRALDARRKKNLDVSVLRPWDLGVDEKGRRPLRPFEGGQQLIERTRDVFDALDSSLGELFRTLGDNEQPGGCLDLDSRKGKAPGGYQYMRNYSRMPFIFMNAAGLHRDVATMVHEAGHAFHSFLCRDEPLLAYRDYPTEFAEVASITMELMTMPYWGSYYVDPVDADRARREQLEGSIALLPWIATIDAFQHWIYTHPDHSREERRIKWLTLLERFGHDVSWEGLDEQASYMWHRQGHLFGHAFYYIEYGIAQLGALGIWQHSLERGEQTAIELYKKALSLGGSQPLPSLFQAADLQFDFGCETVGRLVKAVEDELAKLPD